MWPDPLLLFFLLHNLLIKFPSLRSSFVYFFVGGCAEHASGLFQFRPFSFLRVVLFVYRILYSYPIVLAR